MKKTMFILLALIIAHCMSYIGIVRADTLGSLPLGKVIQMTGKNSLTVYKFIKFSDDTYNNNLEGANLWMLGDNYCVLHAEKDSACVNHIEAIYPNLQMWNSTSDGIRTNNWSTVIQNNNTNSIWNKVLSPMYDDLPATIGGMPKDNAIMSYPYDMYSITYVNDITSVSQSHCYLTAGDNNIDITNCTHTAKISLPSYSEWQNGLNPPNLFVPNGTPTAEYQKTRFDGRYGGGGNYYLFTQWEPWFRSPAASDTSSVWLVSDYGSTRAVYKGDAVYGHGVSPVLWLASSIQTIAGNGTYVDPYTIHEPINCSISKNENKLACLAGEAIQIAPATVADQAIGNFKFLVTNEHDGDYTMVMMMNNYCAWDSDGCSTSNGTYWNNTSGTYGTNDLSSGSNSAISKITYQLSNFYHNGLPSTIGGVAKSSAVRTTTWSMNDFSNNPSSPTYNTCPSGWTSTNSTSDFTFSSTGCTMTSKVALISAPEWQGGNIGLSTEPDLNSVGNLFCKLRFNSACLDSNLYSFYSQPWTRSAFTSSTSIIWTLFGGGNISLLSDYANSQKGVLPVFYLSSNLEIDDGSGTYADPYTIYEPMNCDNLANMDKLECQTLGTVIQMTGEDSGITYKFIKFSDDTYNNNLHYANMWMLGDNYCHLHAGTSRACVDADGVPQTNFQVWNSASDGIRWNNWVTMINTPNSVWDKALSPMYDDLPATIGGIAKDTAIRAYPFDMFSTGTHVDPILEYNCYLTANDSNVNITNCTYTTKISLPSYKEWQNGLSNPSYYSPNGTPAAEYQKARFDGKYGGGGDGGDYGDGSALFADWRPWLRTPLNSNDRTIWNIAAGTDVDNGWWVDDAELGVSPVIYLASNLKIAGGAGTYDEPYFLASPNIPPTLTIDDPTNTKYVNAGSIANNLDLELTGTVTDPDASQIVTIEATVSGLTASGWQATPLDNSPYALTFDSSLLIEGEYKDIIVEAFDNYENPPEIIQETLDSIIVDKTLPTATYSATGGSSNDDGTTWQSDPSISIVATDANSTDPNASGYQSGLKGYKFSWLSNTSLDTDYTTQCTTSLDLRAYNDGITTIPNNGTHTLCLSATDNANNTYVGFKTFTLNTNLPSIISEITAGTQGNNNWYLNQPTLSLTANDNNGSGLSSIVYKYVPNSQVGTGDYTDGYDVTLDSTATTSAVSGTTATLDLIIPEGSYRIYFAVTDATQGVKSETYYEDIKVDLASPVSVIESVEYGQSGESIAEVPLSSDDVNYVLYQNTNQLSASNTINSQIFVDLNSDGGNTDALTLSLNMFDPLSSDLTQAAPSGMSSGINTCLLEVRSANILTDGSGKIESTFDEILNQVQDDNGEESGMTPDGGEFGMTLMEVINFSNWTTLSTNCSDTYDLVPQAHTLYQLRLSATDNASNQGNTFVSSTVIYNLGKIFTPDFVTIDNNALSANMAGNIMIIDCTSGTCIPDNFDITGSLSTTSQVTEYELCLSISGVSASKCTSVTTSTENITNYSLLFTIDDFPTHTDVFPGGNLTIVAQGSGNSIVKPVNIVFYIKRNRPNIIPTVKTGSYVHMIDSRLN